jgi:exonuclease VII small subunit
MNKKERIIKEIEKVDITERFPIKKKLDLKKELADAISEINFVAELSFLIGHLEDNEIDLEESINQLKGFLTRIATCKIILEKIQSKL